MNEHQIGEAVGAVMRDLYPEGVGASAQIRPAGFSVSSPRPRRSRAALGAISAALVVVAVAGVIVAVDNRDRPLAPSAAAAESASLPTPPSASPVRALVLPKVAGDRLTRPYSLDAGQLQLEPAPVDAKPGLTVSAARTRGQQHGWIDTSARSSVFLAVLTSYARATVNDPETGRLRPNIDKRLVWVLFQRDVRQYFRGGGASITGGKPSRVTGYMLSVRFNALDARTGKNIEGDYLTSLTDDPAVTTAPTR